MLPAIGACRPVPGQGPIQMINHCGIRHVGSQGHHKAVESPDHIKPRSQRFPVHPQHAITLIVRQHPPRRNHINKLRRFDNTGQDQRLAPAIDDARKPVTGGQIVGFGKASDGHDLLVASRHRQSSLTDEKPVDIGLRVRWQ